VCSLDAAGDADFGEQAADEGDVGERVQSVLSEPGGEEGWVKGALAGLLQEGVRCCGFVGGRREGEEVRC